MLKCSALEHAGLNTIGHGHSASILSYSLRLCAACLTESQYLSLDFDPVLETCTPV